MVNAISLRKHNQVSCCPGWWCHLSNLVIRDVEGGRHWQRLPDKTSRSRRRSMWALHVLQRVTQLLVKLIIHPGAREGRRRAVTSHAHVCVLAHKHTGIFSELLGKSKPVLPSFHLKRKCLTVSHFWDELQWQSWNGMLLLFSSYSASKTSSEIPSDKQWLHCPFGSADKHWLWSAQFLPDIIP